MYKLTPYYVTSEVLDTPDCMYKLKRIYDDKNSKSSTEDLSAEVAALEKRQEDILARLHHLKEEVTKLARNQFTHVSHEPSCDMPVTDDLPPASGVIQDIVINANPSNPPLSVIVLYELLSKQYRLLATSYVHSSVSSVSVNLKNVFSSGATVVSRTGYHFALSLIWKNDKFGASMMLSPNVQTRVYGEANIARYLGRLLNPAYDAGDLTTVAEIDHWLDQATQLIHGSNKERASILRSISARLSKHSWLVGSDLTLADIVMWSGLQQCKMVQAIPGNVKQWLDACEGRAIFKHALQVAKNL